MKHIFSLIICSFLLLISTQSAFATSTTLYPSDDTYINGNASYVFKNYGSYPTLRVSGLPQKNMAMLFKFPVSSLPADKTISSAKFKLYYYQTLDNTVLPSGMISFTPITSAWSEDSVTWSNRPSVNIGGILSGIREIVDTDPGYQEWDITPLVQQWVNHPDQNFGFMIETLDVGWSCGLDSAEGVYQPKLVVQYGLSLPTFIKPAINIIPEFIVATPTPMPLPSLQPSPSPTPASTPSLSPTPTAKPIIPATPWPTTQPNTSPEPKDSMEDIFVPVTEPKTTNNLPIMILVTVAVICLIGVIIIITLLQKGNRMSEPQPNNVVENSPVDLPAPPAPTNTKLIVILVVLVVIGFSAVTALLGYMYASKKLSKTTLVVAPSPQVTTTSPTPLPSPTSMPKPTLTPNLYGNTFNSSALGVGFYYAAKISGSNEAIDVVEKDNTIYVYAKGTSMESGQSVQRFFKDPTVSLETAITDQFLKNIPADKCFVKELAKLENGIVKATIDYPVPANSGEPFFMFGEECPQKYKRTNGVSYFYYDPKVADRYFFFSIGQYSIPAYSNTAKTSWQDTVKVY